MKFSSPLALFALSFISPSIVVLGQEAPGPSPTESVGCEPHGDHWHCDAPRTQQPAITGTTTTSTNPGPSPTESIGCEPHGNHWHCDAPAATTIIGSSTHSHSDHEDPTGIQDPGPSPTQSAGCEPHGDHWHCDGPVSATGTLPAESTGGAVSNLVRLNNYAAVGGVVGFLLLREF
ncbi:hypothetical protein FQN50_005541 [Emmonsiellopsis sp. PD_5]|nr:hypothetical protein FQN50_005541 [Emmonsiellopsis sp. PD_5]